MDRHSWCRRRLTELLAALLAVGVLAGCGGGDDQPQDAGPTTAGLTQAQVRRLEQAVLDQRARALRARDLGAFLRHVDRRDPGLVRRQERYFHNLTQLPLRTLRYQVTDSEFTGLRKLPAWGKDVRVPRVVLSLQLDGYDAVPVRRVVGFVFSFTGGRARIVADRTASGRPLLTAAPAPWDLERITVRTAPGVLGIFDDRTAASADTLVGAVHQGIEQLDRALPFQWSDRVVVYSVAETRFLRSFSDVPGGSIDHLGALTFPTYATTGRTQIASNRMLVMPSSVRAGQPFLGRITRHELSHVAIGPRDDGVPTWVSEGIAEYLGARDLPRDQRIIPTEALSRAQTADEGMPASAVFNNTDQEWHYALSWMAFDYICTEFGESRMWELMDALHNGGSGTRDADQDRVLTQVLGFDSHELALRAAARIRNIYG